MMIPGLSDWLLALVTCLHCACAASILHKTESQQTPSQNKLTEFEKDYEKLNQPFGASSNTRDVYEIAKRINAAAFYGARGKKGISSNAFFGARGKKMAPQSPPRTLDLYAKATMQDSTEQNDAGFKSTPSRSLLQKNHSDEKTTPNGARSRQARSIGSLLKRRASLNDLRYQNGKRVDASAFFGARGKRGYESSFGADGYIVGSDWPEQVQLYEPQLYDPKYDFARLFKDDYDLVLDPNYDVIIDPGYAYNDVIYDDYRGLDPVLLNLAIQLANQDKIRDGGDIHVTSKRGPPAGFHAVRGR